MTPAFFTKTSFSAPRKDFLSQLDQLQQQLGFGAQQEFSAENIVFFFQVFYILYPPKSGKNVETSEKKPGVLESFVFFAKKMFGVTGVPDIFDPEPYAFLRSVLITDIVFFGMGGFPTKNHRGKRGSLSRSTQKNMKTKGFHLQKTWFLGIKIRFLMVWGAPGILVFFGLLCFHRTNSKGFLSHDPLCVDNEKPIGRVAFFLHFAFFPVLFFLGIWYFSRFRFPVPQS